MRIFLLSLFLLTVTVSVEAAPEGASGLPVPRYVSLRHSEVNMRTGPGVRYPIDWVYRLPNMPMEVIAEYDTWRKVRDPQGAEGWVHLSVLSGRRYALMEKDNTALHRDASEASPAVAFAEKNVLGRILSCDAQWCRMDISGFRGWVMKEEIWGVYPQEVLE